jgi:hypothetical protein
MNLRAYYFILSYAELGKAILKKCSTIIIYHASNLNRTGIQKVCRKKTDSRLLTKNENCMECARDPKILLTWTTMNLEYSLHHCPILLTPRCKSAGMALTQGMSALSSHYIRTQRVVETDCRLY